MSLKKQDAVEVTMSYGDRLDRIGVAYTGTIEAPTAVYTFEAAGWQSKPGTVKYQKRGRGRELLLRIVAQCAANIVDKVDLIPNMPGLKMEWVNDNRLQPYVDWRLADR